MVAFVSSVAGQTVMDGSDKKLTKAQRTALVESISSFASDPYRAELRRLHMGVSGVYCGEVNLANTGGGHNGYGRLYRDPINHNNQIIIPAIPEPRASTLPKIEAACGEK